MKEMSIRRTNTQKEIKNDVSTIQNNKIQN